MNVSLPSNYFTAGKPPATAGTRRLSTAILLLFVLGASLAGFSGCASVDRALRATGLKDVSTPETAEDLLTEGMKDFNHGRYTSALKSFEKLQEQYPFSQYSLQAELKIADSHYHLDHYEEARVFYEEFENNHPTNEAMPYVLFQIGMSYFQQIGTIDRDTTGAAEAVQAFARLLRTFPQSPYTAEAQERIQEARDVLARHEMYVAEFYVRTGEYEQAEGRLEYLLLNFPESSVVPKARETLASLAAGDPPGRSWRSWIPLLPD